MSSAVTAQSSAQPVLRVGTLVYWQTVWSGLLKGRIVEILNRPPSNSGVKIEIMATRRAYKRGTIVEDNFLHVWPRECVRIVRGSFGQRFTTSSYTVEYPPVQTIAALYRVTIGLGHPVQTGNYYDKAECERALKNFRRCDKAWLQESLNNGQTWRTLDV